MDISRKIEIADLAIKSISRHDDEDSIVLKAALTKVSNLIQAEVQGIDQRAAARVAVLAPAE